MDLDIAQVRAFVVTADQRHFAKAAETLFLTRQALSRRVGKLEEALATPLFLRTDQAVELTEDGERFLPYARELLQTNDAALEVLGADESPVRLDVLDDRLSPMFLLRLLAGRDPELQLRRHTGHGLAHALDPLVLGEVDVAFGRVADLGRELPAELDHRLIRLEPVVALVAPEHPLAGVHVLRLADLREEGIWLPSAAEPAEWLAFVRRLCAEFEVPIHSSPSPDLRRVTLAGADTELDLGLELQVLPLEPSPLFPWSLVWRRGRQRPAVRRFLELTARTGRDQEWCARDPVRSWVPDELR